MSHANMCGIGTSDDQQWPAGVLDVHSLQRMRETGKPPPHTFPGTPLQPLSDTSGHLEENCLVATYCTLLQATGCRGGARMR